jgi:hypothetical protein
MENENAFSSPLYPSAEEVRGLGVPEDLMDLFIRQKYRLAFGVESWYYSLKQHTFPSAFCKIGEKVLSLTGFVFNILAGSGGDTGN